MPSDAAARQAGADHGLVLVGAGAEHAAGRSRRAARSRRASTKTSGEADEGGGLGDGARLEDQHVVAAVGGEEDRRR